MTRRPPRLPPFPSPPLSRSLDLPEGARVADALAALGHLADGMPLVMAVNREYAREDAPLDPGDELALIPPVSGGEAAVARSEEHTSELQSRQYLVCRLLLEK